ncbi:MAG: glutamate--tRNA ligase [Pseudomonadota bacterium]
MTQSSAPVTRFAPSPTGFLHIGGARTALFNWLFARGNAGKFLLRIEDTDRARHNEAAVEAILDGLFWLGLDYDGEPISQYSRRDHHVEVAEQLLASGNAYRCFMTAEETDLARAAAREKGERFTSPWRDRDGPYPDTPFAIRFKAPLDGETRVEDAVQGPVTFPNSALDDMIILRSGEDGAKGAATYNLAVVADDHAMEITHVIRGDDHLANAARQSQIYDALGWRRPVFAHVPLIHGSDGAKLSKRHGALGVEAYRDDGYLPEALANYLLRLGWSHGDEEIIPRKRALEIFDLKGVNKAPARLDLEKLANINASYLANMSGEALLEACLPPIELAHGTISDADRSRLMRATPFLAPRMKTLNDAPAAAAFILLRRPFPVEGKAAKPLKKEGAKETLADVTAVLERAPVSIWDDASALDLVLQDFAEQKGLGFGQIGPPARAALTAGNPAPSLGETLFVLGREEALARLKDQGR